MMRKLLLLNHIQFNRRGNNTHCSVTLGAATPITYASPWIGVKRFHTCTHFRIHIWTHLYINVLTHVCTHTYTHIYIHCFTCITTQYLGEKTRLLRVILATTGCVVHDDESSQYSKLDGNSIIGGKLVSTAYEVMWIFDNGHVTDRSR